MQVFNPYLPNYEYIPDGEPHVFGDRLYVFGSHDRFNGEDSVLPTVIVTYFVQDQELNRHSQKTGGTYVNLTGQVQRVDMTLGTISFRTENSNKRKDIVIADINDIQISSLHD